MVEIRWHGRGGQGCWTAARLLGKAVTLFEKKFAIAFPAFGPERRGAPVLGFTKIDNRKIHDRSEIESCDQVIILDETLIDHTLSRGIKEHGTVIINSPAPDKYADIFRNKKILALDATTIALNIIKKPITNTAMLAALAASSSLVSLNSINQAIESELPPPLIEKNLKVVALAYQAIQEKING